MAHTEHLFTDNEKLINSLINKKYKIFAIAKEMKISIHTVKSHVSKIKRMNLD